MLQKTSPQELFEKAAIQDKLVSDKLVFLLRYVLPKTGVNGPEVEFNRNKQNKTSNQTFLRKSN